MNARAVRSRSETDTEEIARQLARRLHAGSIVLLTGDLGAGKTAFVRGMADGLGIPSDVVSSPTFTIVQEYRGRLPLYHVDLYRLNAREIEDLGLEELGTDGVVAVEWADKLPRSFPGAVDVTIEDAGGDERIVRLKDCEL